MIDGASALLASLGSLAIAATGIIGGLITWRKAANERTVLQARLFSDRMRDQDERMDKMQAVIDRLRRREQTLVTYVYGLQRQIIGLGGNPPPWPRVLDSEDERP